MIKNKLVRDTINKMNSPELPDMSPKKRELPILPAHFDLPKIIKDHYRKVRGGKSEILSITCGHCQTPISLYQKDGPGRLKRMYVDRTYPYDEGQTRHDPVKFESKSKMTPLACASCHTVIGLPIVYRPEHRLAYRLIPGTFKKSILTKK